MNDITNTETIDLHDTEIEFSEGKTEVSEFIADKTDLSESESSERTLRRSLAAYEIGKKLRQLRLKKKIALVDLGKHTGLSASMLSQLENGKLVPTLPTLTRLLPSTSKYEVPEKGPVRLWKPFLSSSELIAAMSLALSEPS